MGWCKNFCVGFAKSILFLSNLIIFIFSIVLVTKAIILKVRTSGLDVGEVSSFAIGVGIIIAAIAFFGCWGAIQENSCMLTIYAGIMLFFFILQLILVILAFVGYAHGDKTIRGEVTKELTNKYNYLNITENLDDINSIQTYLQCCGLDGPKGKEVHTNGTVLMKSCCGDGTAVCTEASASVYKDGCITTLKEFILVTFLAIGIFTLFFAILDLLCALFAFCVRGSIRRDAELLP